MAKKNTDETAGETGKGVKVKYLVNLPKQKKAKGDVRVESPEFLATLVEDVEYTADPELVEAKKK